MPNYNETACAKLKKNYFSANFHIQDPISVNAPFWAGNSCPPVNASGFSILGDPRAGERGCKIGGFPVSLLTICP
jgi:hypothetical protein